MARLEQWPRILDDVAAVRRNMPFQWGVHDCLYNAFAFAEAITGRKFALPDYDSAFGARHVDVGKIATAHFGWPVEGWKSAGRGDIGLVDARRDWGLFEAALAVVVGSEVIAPGPDFMVGVPLDRVLKTWRVV